MTDIRTVLHQAAPEPRRPLDMAAVRARARRPSRRLAVWLGTIVAAGGLALPVGGGSLLNPADESTVEHTAGTTIQPPDLAGESSDSDDARPSSAVGHGGRASSPPAVAAADSGTPARTGSSATGAGAAPSHTGAAWTTTPQTPTTVHPDFPLAPSCSVTSAGMATGEERRCRFTATEQGGASLETDDNQSASTAFFEATVTRTRQGETFVWQRNARVRSGDMALFVGCPSEFISPGDMVEVVLRKATDTDRIATLGAGADWDNC